MFFLVSTRVSKKLFVRILRDGFTACEFTCVSDFLLNTLWRP
jgi:hypothetical protein